jgi:hypothetical protein
MDGEGVKMSGLIDAIKDFLIYSANNGYGNEQIKSVTETDKSHTIEVKRGSYKSHDNYFGGEPYGGRVVIHKADKPVWMMVYYGSISENSGLAVEEIYSFLRKNLLNPDPKMPIRGPLSFKQGKWDYKADIKGDLTDFRCEETISYDNQVIYKASFAGGLVDKHNG